MGSNLIFGPEILVFLFGCCSIVALNPLYDSVQRERRRYFSFQQCQSLASHDLDNNDAKSAYTIDGEVVGASGRIGSQILRLTMGPESNKQSKVLAVPRGLCPGSLTEQIGKPIYVTTASSNWPDIYDVTLPHRRSDLVWIGNGLLDEKLHKNATVVVAHYGILQVGQEPTTSNVSPPTLIYGRHSGNTKELLEQDGISVELISDWNEIKVAAARKVLWSATMWLLCHCNKQSADSDSNPLTVSEVHEVYPGELRRLVMELWPQLQQIVKDQTNESPATSHDKLEETLAYMKKYSFSMRGAVPSFELAKAEFRERNGIFLTSREEQPFHYHLLETVLGSDCLDTLLETARTALSLPRNNKSPKVVHLPGTRLSVYGRPRTDPDTRELPPQTESIVVVGGGFVGSAIAMNLARARLGRTITVVDAQQTCSASSSESCSSSTSASKTDPSWPLGVTTKSSWAWLNGNQKSPPLSYQWLNQLGMILWRQDPVIQSLPLWKGSLVQCRELLPDTATFLAGYPSEGPLSRERIQQLEPYCAFQEEGSTSYHTYFFPDEGCVDPSDAIHTMREFALKESKSRVSFLFDQKVVETIHDMNGLVTGVACENASQPGGPESTDPFILPADVVIFAAGVASQEASLGGIPLKHSPGTIVLSKETTREGNQDEAALQRILVDACHESHILQRRDGSFAIGGGYLQVGGSSAAQSRPDQKEEADQSEAARMMISTAEKYVVAPSLAVALNSNSSRSTHRSVRPMPKDGFPCVGFLADKGADGLEKKGLYSVVSHSAITLGPLIAQLVTAEIQHDLNLELLESYRPSRFFESDEEHR